MPKSIYVTVRNKPEYDHRMVKPTCTMCKQFPKEAKVIFDCPIYGSTRFRTSNVPRARNCRSVTYLCFEPITKQEYVELLEYKYLKKLEWQRKWNKANPKTLLAYYNNNKWRFKLIQAKYRTKNKDRIKAKNKLYYLEHKEKILAYQRDYRLRKKEGKLHGKK